MRITRHFVAGGFVAVLAALLVSTGGATPAFTIQNTRPPVITGQATTGSILTTSHGKWQRSSPHPGGSLTFKIAWERCSAMAGGCQVLPGETNSTYLVRSADEGNRLRSHVTASQGPVTASASSQETSVIPGGASTSQPANTSAPVITGTAKQGATLTGNPGTWTGAQPITYTYQWFRCNHAGGACGAISGATSPTIALGSDDVGKRLKVKVTARNSHGTTAVVSAPSDVVGPAGGGGGGGTGNAVDVASLSSTDRLQMNTIQFVPSVITSRDPFVLRVTVTDAAGQRVRGALVYAIALPYGLVHAAPEVSSDSSGVASLTLVPTAALQVGKAGSIQFFLRARRGTDSLLGGISNRRLIQVIVH